MAHRSKVKSGLEGKARKQAYEASNHIASMDRKQRGRNAGVCVRAHVCECVVCAWYVCVGMHVVCVCVPKYGHTKRPDECLRSPGDRVTGTVCHQMWVLKWKRSS